MTMPTAGPSAGSWKYTQRRVRRSWWRFARRSRKSSSSLTRRLHSQLRPKCACLSTSWTIFLHPAQRQLVERDYGGPARVAGSAGTGKTIVALHRAVFLARTHPEARVLLSTFSDTLAYALRTKLRRLISNEPRLGERLEVHAMNTLGQRLYALHFGSPKAATRDEMRALLAETARTVEGHKFSQHFLLSEWEEVVDAWQLDTWEAYRDVRRLGRKTRLPESQ